MGIDHLRGMRMPLIQVIAAKRGIQWIYGPDEDTMIKEGDVLFARGPVEGEKELLGLTR